MTTAAAVSTARATACHAESPHGIDTIGASAHRRATHAMAWAGAAADHATTAAAAGQSDGQHRHDDPGDRGRRDEGCGEQVGHDGDDGDRPLERHDERRAHRLRRQGHGDDRAEPGRGAAAALLRWRRPTGCTSTSSPRVATDERAKP